MAEATAKKQRGKGRPFPKGVSGNPAGRPVGSISIIGEIKKIWNEHPERFKQYIEDVMEDEKLRKELIQQIDGAPAHKVDVTSGGEPLKFGIISFDDYDSPQSESQ